MTPTFPLLLPPPLPALNECGGNLASQRLGEMKTFLKWHVPVAECWQPALWGIEPVPCASPKYPKYVPSSAAKPQQCLLVFPSSLGPRVCMPTVRPQWRQRCQGRCCGQPGARRTAGLVRLPVACPSQLWPLCLELLSRGQCVCIMGK